MWAEKFRAAGVPIVGDDIKSQVGATITHRVLAKLFEDRGVQLDRTMQLNVGGNMDFLNMKELERLESKKVSKTQAVTSQVDRDLGKDNVHIGPSDYVAWLDDRKWAYVRLEGRAFGDVPLNLEYKLEVWDSPNSAGIIIDAVRAAKIAKDRGIGGPILSASSYFMKSPPEQYATTRPATPSRRSSAASGRTRPLVDLRPRTRYRPCPGPSFAGRLPGLMSFHCGFLSFWKCFRPQNSFQCGSACTVPFWKVFHSTGSITARSRPESWVLVTALTLVSPIPAATIRNDKRVTPPLGA